MSAQPEIFRSAEVPAALAGLRLDQAAAELIPEHSRSRLRRWIESGELLLDGVQCRPRQPVQAGQEIVLRAAPPPAEDWTIAQPIEFEVIFEDASLLVVNKPAGLTVHPGAGQPDGTLVNGLLHRFPAQKSLPRAGIVHRLDAGTTGLLVVARTLETHTALVAALSRHDVQRQYQAVVEGVMTGPQRVDKPLGRDPRNRLRMAVVDSGRPAVTHVRMLRQFSAHTQVEAQLETGRTHQIRVHLRSIRHPLVGDSLYGARRVLPRAASEPARGLVRAFSRPALHAEYLAFDHPASGTALEFHCPPPPDFVELLQAVSSTEGAL